MDVRYNSDYRMTFRGLQTCDIFQLSEFVLALERDIPQWKHLWASDDKLRKEKAKINGRIHSVLGNIRVNLMLDTTEITAEQEQWYRLRYYNVKALQLMLSHDNPFWENQKSEADILQQFQLLHIDAPMEEWYEEWTRFYEGCLSAKAERARIREERHNQQMKLQHLINIKQLKMEALIKTIEMHPSMIVSIHKTFDVRKPHPDTDRSLLHLCGFNRRRHQLFRQLQPD